MCSAPLYPLEHFVVWGLSRQHFQRDVESFLANASQAAPLIHYRLALNLKCNSVYLHINNFN